MIPGASAFGETAFSALPHVPYERELLDSAVRFANNKEYSVAVILAHVACEVRCDQALSSAFGSRGISDLAPSVRGLLDKSNLNDLRVRKLFTALTGDDPTKTVFWADFTKSVTTRNAVVHGKKKADEPEASRAIKVARALIDHLNRVVP